MAFVTRNETQPMKMENITDLRFTDLHAEKVRNKFSFVSWSKKPRANQMARIAFFTCEENDTFNREVLCFLTRGAYQCHSN